jgi:hypothetical protein
VRRCILWMTSNTCRNAGGLERHLSRVTAVELSRGTGHEGRVSTRPVSPNSKEHGADGRVARRLEDSVVKARSQVVGSKARRGKKKSAKSRPRARFIGTRPLMFPMTLRGQVVDVEVLPAVGTTTHVNYEITISLGGKILDWVPTRAELERIGRSAGMLTEPQTSH